MLCEEDILYQNGPYWVVKEKRHGREMFLIYRDESTHSVLFGTIDYEGEKGLSLAKEKCDQYTKK